MNDSIFKHFYSIQETNFLANVLLARTALNGTGKEIFRSAEAEDEINENRKIPDRTNTL
jgi:hypothetical protein